MKKIEELTEAEKGYFAGFFDGEGCVLIAKAKRKSGGTCHYGLVVSFGITYAPILYKMKSIFNGNIWKENSEKRKNQLCVVKSKAIGILNPDNWKERYCYTLSGKDAWVFLKIIYPYCNEKKEQVRIAIDYFNSKRGGTGCTLSKTEIERNEYYYKSLQNLKHDKMIIKENEDFIDSQTKLEIFSEV